MILELYFVTYQFLYEAVLIPAFRLAKERGGGVINSHKPKLCQANFILCILTGNFLSIKESINVDIFGILVYQTSLGCSGFLSKHKTNI